MKKSRGGGGRGSSTVKVFAARKGKLFRNSSLAKGILFGVAFFVEFSLGKGKNLLNDFQSDADPGLSEIVIKS